MSMQGSNFVALERVFHVEMFAIFVSHVFFNRRRLQYDIYGSASSLGDRENITVARTFQGNRAAPKTGTRIRYNRE